MYPKDVLQLIGNYLNALDFYMLHNICNLSIDNYVKNIKINRLPIDGSHEMTDELIKRNLICDLDVIIYSLKYDRPKYIRLFYSDDILKAIYNKTDRCVIKCISDMPNIIMYNYTFGFRLNGPDLVDVFRSNNIVLMKFIQNYPQKSEISLKAYYNYGGRNLWKLNYKHKIGYCLMKSYPYNFYGGCFMAGYLSGYIVGDPTKSYKGLLQTCGVSILISTFGFNIFDRIFNMKLPL